MHPQLILISLIFEIVDDVPVWQLSLSFCVVDIEYFIVFFAFISLYDLRAE